MKGFFRTIAGKTILFILCIVSALTVAVCAFCAITAYEYDFYQKSEEVVFRDFISPMAVSDWRGAVNSPDHEISDGIKIYNTDTGNLIFEVTDQFGNILEKSKNAGAERMSFSYNYEVSWSVYGTDQRFIRSIRSDGYNVQFKTTVPEDGIMYLTISFEKGMPRSDIYSLDYRLFHLGYQFRYLVFAIAAAAILLGMICFIGLMRVSAKRRQDDELHPGVINRVPFDIILAMVVFIGLFIVFGIGENIDRCFYDPVLTVMFISACTAGFAMFLGLCMDAAARIKQGTLFKNTLFFRLLLLFKKVFKWIWGIAVRVPLVWKTAVCLSVLFVIDVVFILFLRRDPDMLLAWLAFSRIAVLGGGVFLALKLRTLQMGARALAQGDLNYRTETDGLFLDLKEHAENLNNISLGLSNAVEQRLKSERMKTELITNVSHDIKTPLTSIINYVGLIASETCDNPKHAEYTEVLCRQSERLKKLIEDLVEASKASTGNLDVSLVPCDASVFITQVAGEYDEKLKTADLTLIVRQPEEPIRILADGRRMWRIFDNLMNNICKYSMPGTRVYLSLEQKEREAVFTFRNTSRDILAVSEEELMERFVRGDSSRNTEGNGLGLSIAKSMAQLQNGSLSLEIDGDLFKIILRFPAVS